MVLHVLVTLWLARSTARSLSIVVDAVNVVGVVGCCSMSIVVVGCLRLLLVVVVVVVVVG